eukprot:COSAG01_NODE_6114_length_3843_cov_2.175481_8_plen_138_part_00
MGAVIQKMTARLAELGASGPAWAWPLPNGSPARKLIDDEICAAQNRTGYNEPVRTSLPPLPPPTPPSPSPPTPPLPPPGPPPSPECARALKQYCPKPFKKGFKWCLACTRGNHTLKPVCEYISRVDYCRNASVVLSV